MQINITWDASVANAPAGYKAAVQAAVTYLEQTLSAPITVNIAFGWGEVEGQALPAGSIGSSLSPGYALSYQDFRNALWADATTPDALAAAKALPASDPTHGGTFYIASAEAKALGLVDPTDSQIDGYVGLDSTTSFTFDPNNRAQPGLVDAIGALEHEITEVLGRTSYLGYQPGDGSSLYGALDLFRYTAPGVLNPSSATGSFSVNGQTLLLPFDNPINGGDSGDWSQTVTGDSFDAFGGPNEADLISATDLRVMDVLGYHAPTAAPALQTPNVAPIIRQLEVTQDLQLSAGQTTYFTDNGSSVWGYIVEQKSDTYPFPMASLTNAGTIVASGHQVSATAVTVSGGPSQGATSIFNEAGGTIIAEESGSISDGTPIATGIEGNDSQAITNLENAGLIEAIAPDTWAVGADVATFTGDTSGKVTVWAAGMAWGVMSTKAFTNAGDINVVGGGAAFATSFPGYSPTDIPIGAIGVLSTGTFSNSGTISARNTQPGSVSLGVEVSRAVGVIENSGLIKADYAIFTPPAAGSDDSSNTNNFNETIDNSGQIIGATVLTDGNSTIDNTGLMAGAIQFGQGNSTYDGASGHLYGAIYLGLGVNSVKLGADGNAVYGGGGSDTVTGGAGDDFIEIPRGSNTIDGGSGFNTLSFGDATGAVNVNLGTGVATAAGTDSIRNIQRVIGSDYDDTLVAGAAAAVLIGGGGRDTLIGGAGNDTLVSGSGGGVMTGGGGNDTFVYTKGDHQLVITDFGGNDVLQIYGYAAAQSTQQQGPDTLVVLASGDSILLKNVQATSLNGANVQYSQVPLADPVAPPSLPEFGAQSIGFRGSFAILAGEHFDISDPVFNTNAAFDNIPIEPGLVLFGFSLSSRTFSNAGEVHVSAAAEEVTVGLFIDPNSGGTFQVTNAAGAQFRVDNSVGWAIGVTATELNFTPVGLDNAGNLLVSAGGPAAGVELVNSPGIINRAGGVISASSTVSVASALVLMGGASVENDGLLKSAGTGPSTLASLAWDVNAAVWSFAGFSGLTNKGSIVATAQGGTSYGIYATGNDQPSPQTLDNRGTITADVAILFGVGGASQFESPSVNLINSGTINGDIDLGGAFNTITSTGTINGNILLHDDDTEIGVKSVTSLDLRGGVLNGDITVRTAADFTVSDTIYTGANSTTIKVEGGSPTFTLSVTGGGGQVAIQLDIASGAASETHNADGSWTVNAGTDGTLTLKGVQTLVFTDKTVTLTAAVAAPAADDFNGDGKSDFLIQNGSGAVVTGQIGGGQTAYAQVAALGSEWSFVGSGNVLGHGKTDFVIHNSAGAVVVGEVGSGGQAAYTQVAALGSEWAFHGVGDFLGDGHADVLIQNTAGAVVLGEVSGGQTSYSQIAALGPEWAFKGVGDFNGDGKADFLIENGSGAIVMGEVGQSGQAGYSQVGALGPEWSFKEVGAFLGDGKTGFLIESSGGAVVVGELTNGQASYTQIAALGPEWSFVGAGDYLGEGHDQFLMQSTSGAVVVGDWSGGQIHYSQVAALGPEWHFHP